MSMIFYWASAERIREDGSEDRLFTQTACSTEEEARKQIDFWKEQYGFKIKTAWIDVVENHAMTERIEVEV